MYTVCVVDMTDVSGLFALATTSASEINSLLIHLSTSTDRLNDVGNDTTGPFHLLSSTTAVVVIVVVIQ